ncbi:MAG: tetratricopeptide repeat protein [Betaproteobacteria bacterium]|nr:tetratricopeptide repeat protein [Betaproteobacteria bacterium]
MYRRILPHLASMGAIVALACALYVPFLGNPMVFDDRSLFSGARFAYYATTPFGLDLRLLPYFTLAFPQVMWGHFPPWAHAEIHRILSLVFHIATALALYKLVHDLLLGAARPDAKSPEAARVNAIALAFFGAAVFAIHPVAVYGAGYLVQRTTILATLFSLLSIIYFVRGLGRARHVDALAAAFFYTLAVFSKEHSVLLPAAAVMVTPLLTQDRHFAIRYAGIYLLACLPAAITVVTLIRWVIGQAYEPGVDLLLAQIEGIPALDTTGGPWLVSAVTQAGLFFKYLAFWLAPDTGTMSVDIRIDFAQTWSPGWIVLKVAAFLAVGLSALVLLRRGGRAGLVGFGLLYTWILFAVELSSVRFQEPFVLYRSYLWAPGILMAVVAVLSGLSRRAALALFAAVSPLLLYQAHDRLQSFSSNLALWEDAAAKLPSTPVPWGSRTLFNLGRAQVYANQADQAIDSANRCMTLYPRTFYCYFARGAVHIQIGEYEQALPYLERALTIYPDSGIAYHHRGLALEKLGRLDEARQAYRKASRLRFAGAHYRLDLLESTGGGSQVLYDTSRSLRKPE